MPSKSLNERAEYDRGYVEGYRLGQKDFAEKAKAEIENDSRDCGCDEFVDGINHALEIIDNIGKGNKE